MLIENARFANADGGIILADFDGALMNVPVDGSNRHYQAILDQGIVVAPYVGPSAAQMRPGMSLTFAQLIIGLEAEGWITSAEAEAWLSGSLPVAVITLIESLPEAQRFAAKARAARPSIVLRMDPLVISLALAQSKTEAELDTFFTTYAQV